MVVLSGFFHAKRTPGNWYWPFSYDFWFKSYSKFNFLGQKRENIGKNQQIFGEKNWKYWKIKKKLKMVKFFDRIVKKGPKMAKYGQKW